MSQKYDPRDKLLTWMAEALFELVEHQVRLNEHKKRRGRKYDLFPGSLADIAEELRQAIQEFNSDQGCGP